MWALCAAKLPGTALLFYFLFAFSILMTLSVAETA
jgi:hypothetical protein